MQAVNTWIRRVTIITSVLENLPRLLAETTTDNPTDNITPPCPISRNTIDISTAPEGGELPANLNPISILYCSERDQYQCMITGRKTSDGFKKNVERIISFAIENDPECGRLELANMFEIIYGSEETGNLLARVLDRINHVENLVSLNSSINTKFANGT